jgi:hypothetical protein
MKNAIFQYFLNFNGVGKQGHHYPTEGIPDWAELSVHHFQEYANKHNADHFFLRDRFVNATSNFFEVTRIFKDPIFDDYDTVLYLDVDVIPKNKNANIFEVPFGDVAGWPEHRHPDVAVSINWERTPAIVQRFADFGAEAPTPKTVPASLRMINSGVMLWSREARLKARELFDDHEKWFHHKNALLDPKWTSAGHSSHCLDQPYLNAMWSKFNFDVTELDIVWNRFPTKNENRPCNFAHYVGDYRFNIPKWFPKQ